MVDRLTPREARRIRDQDEAGKRAGRARQRALEGAKPVVTQTVDPAPVVGPEWPKPETADIEALRQSPTDGALEAFEQKFGPGSTHLYLNDSDLTVSPDRQDQYLLQRYDDVEGYRALDALAIDGAAGDGAADPRVVDREHGLDNEGVADLSPAEQEFNDREGRDSADFPTGPGKAAPAPADTAAPPPGAMIGDAWRAAKGEPAAGSFDPVLFATGGVPLDEALAAQASMEAGAGDTLKAVAGDVAGGTIEAPRQAVGGVRDAAQSTVDFIQWAGGSLGNLARRAAGKEPLDLSTEDNFKLPGVAAPRTATGAAVRNAAQFFAEFAGVGKVTGPLKALTEGGKVTEAAYTAARGALADFLGFEPDQGRVADMFVEKFPELKNPVTEYLKSDPSDNEAEGRFKNALEGAGIGLAADGVLKLFRATRAAIPAGEQRSPKGDRLPVQPEGARDLLLLGSRDAPLTVRPGAADAAPSPAAKLDQAGKETDISEFPAAAGPDALTKGLQPIGEGEIYVNFARIESEDDILKIIQDTTTAYKDPIVAARRGVRTHADTQAAAGEIDAFDLLMTRRKGQPLNAEATVAARDLWVGAATKLQEVARVASRDPSAENLVQFRQMFATFHAIQKEVLGARAEAGRALDAWKIPAGGSRVQLKHMEALLDQAGGLDVNADLARKIGGLNDLETLSAMAEKSVYAKTRNAVQEYWINALLSGPKTHVVNVLSNTLTIGLSLAETSVASRVGRLLGHQDAVQVGETLANVQGMLAAQRDALRAASQTWRTGQTGFGVNKIQAARERAISSGAWNMRADSWTGRAVDGIGAVVSAPGRLLQSEDEWFKTIGYRGSLTQQAYRQAQDEIAAGRLTPDKAKEWIAARVENPTEDMRIAAEDQAAYLTFTSDPGPLVQSISALRARYPGLKFVVPFLNVPMNVFKFVGERSPLAPLSAKYQAAIAKGGADADLARTKMAIGTSLILTAMDLALSGQITGSGPSKPADKQNWERLGNRAYSIMIDGKPVAFNRLDPTGTMLAFGADLAEYLMNSDEGIDLDDDTAFERAWGAAVLSAAEVSTSRTSLQGFADTVDAMSNPEKSGVAYLKRFAGSLLVPRLLTETARAVDPVQRDSANIVQEVKARLPFFSETVAPSRDAWGRVRSFRSSLGPWFDALSPIYVGPDVEPQPIDTEMRKDGWYIGMPGKAFILQSAKVPLDRRPDIYSRFLELRGATKAGALDKALAAKYGDRTLLEVLNATVQGQGDLGAKYKALPDSYEREKFIRHIVTDDFQLAAKAAIFREYPEILSGAAEIRAKRGASGSGDGARDE